MQFLFLQSLINKYLSSDYYVLGDVLGHEDTAEKTGTDSALRELVI